MKFLATTQPGMERICAQEVKEFAGAEGVQEPSAVLFDASPAEAVAFCYRTQSAHTVLVLLASFPVAEDFAAAAAAVRQSIADADFSGWLSPGRTFYVQAIRVGSHHFSSPDISREAAAAIGNKTAATPQLKDADVRVLLYLYHGRGYLGIDLIGRDLAKRDYRIFPHPASVNALLCYALVRTAAPDRNAALLDPFCLSGNIAIEAALWMQGMSPHQHLFDAFLLHRLAPFEQVGVEQRPSGSGRVFAFDDSLQSIRAAEKNARIAGIHRRIRFSRAPVEVMDIKVPPKSIDAIATVLPSASHRLPASRAASRYRVFFSHAQKILKPEGRIALLCPDRALAEEQGKGFAVASAAVVGSRPYQLLLMERE